MSTGTSAEQMTPLSTESTTVSPFVQRTSMGSVVSSLVAPAGATSEDTTLPMLVRCTNGETVVLSVLNGVICSALVPVLIEAFHQLM